MQRAFAFCCFFACSCLAPVDDREEGGEEEAPCAPAAELPAVLPLWVLTEPVGGQAHVVLVVDDEGTIEKDFFVPPAVRSPQGLAVDRARNRLIVSGVAGNADAFGTWTIDLDTGNYAGFNHEVRGTGVVVRDDRIFIIGETEKRVGDEYLYGGLTLNELDPLSGEVIDSQGLQRDCFPLDLVSVDNVGDALFTTCGHDLVRLGVDAPDEEVALPPQVAEQESLFAMTPMPDGNALLVTPSGKTWLFDGEAVAQGRELPPLGFITAVAVP